MKKLMGLAVLIGTATASQAGGLHFSLPLPPPPHVVIGRLLPHPSVSIAAGGCYTPPVVVRDRCYPDRYDRYDRYDRGAYRGGYYPERYDYRNYCRDHHRYNCNHRSHYYHGRR